VVGKGGPDLLTIIPNARYESLHHQKYQIIPIIYISFIHLIILYQFLVVLEPLARCKANPETRELEARRRSGSKKKRGSKYITQDPELWKLRSRVSVGTYLSSLLLCIQLLTRHRFNKAHGMPIAIHLIT